MLKDVFYYGDFLWGGKKYRGKHLPLISRELFDQVQAVFTGKTKRAKGSKKQNLAYIGTLTCGDCGCAVTGERKRKKSGLEFIYYRCTNYHRNCPSKAKYYREEVIDGLFGEIVEDCRIDDDRLTLIRKALHESQDDEKSFVDNQIAQLSVRRDLLRARLNKLYLDRVDAKISDVFYDEKRQEWESELREVEGQLVSLGRAERNYYEVGVKFLELSQRLCAYWRLQDNRLERGELIKALLSNCKIKDGSLYPTYRKPFDLIVKGLKTENWGPFTYPRRTGKKFVGSREGNKWGPFSYPW